MDKFRNVRGLYMKFNQENSRDATVWQGVIMGREAG